MGDGQTEVCTDDLVAQVAREQETHKAVVKDILYQLVNDVQAHVKAGRAVQIVGLGRWFKRMCRARLYRTPAGAVRRMGKRTLPRFRMFDAFKKAVA